MNNQLNIAIENAHKNAELAEGIGVVHRFLINAYMYEGISVKKISSKLLIPIPVAAALKNELKKQGIVQLNNGIRLSSGGEKFVSEVLGFKHVNKETLLSVIENTGDDIRTFEPEINKLNEIYKNRPEADVAIDQALCTAETGISRALLMLRAGSLIGKRVLCVGDDDLTSIAIFLILRRISKSGRASEISDITIFDVDKRILGYINDLSIKMGAHINCVQHDFRRTLPRNYANSYDCIFTDPPYTLEGLKLFLSRGVSALKRESDLPFYLAFAHKNPLSQLSMQKLLLDSGFVISRIYERFNKYHGAQILGSASDILVLSTTEKTREMIPGDYNGLLYTNEFNRNKRVYECVNCRTRYIVGFNERFTTIEKLKGTGCGCGSDIFLLKRKEAVN